MKSAQTILEYLNTIGAIDGEDNRYYIKNRIEKYIPNREKTAVYADLPRIGVIKPDKAGLSEELNEQKALINQCYFYGKKVAAVVTEDVNNAELNGEQGSTDTLVIATYQLAGDALYLQSIRNDLKILAQRTWTDMCSHRFVRTDTRQHRSTDEVAWAGFYQYIFRKIAEIDDLLTDLTDCAYYQLNTIDEADGIKDGDVFYKQYIFGDNQ